MNQVAEAAILTPIQSATPKTFFDDFTHDLSNWTIVSGTWAIENEELSQNDTTFMHHIAYAEPVFTNVVVEANVKLISGHAYGAVLARYVDESNYYRVDIRTDTNRVQLAIVKAKGLQIIDEKYFVPHLETWYKLRLKIVGSELTGYVDDVKYVSGKNEEFAGGHIGFNTYASHVHFDDVNATGAGAPSAYKVSVRAGATQIAITCAWNGLENVTIANITSPTKTYYESNMSVYEKTTVSISETTAIVNIKRAMLSIPASTSTELWTLYLNLNSVTTYQVTVEIS